MSVAGQVQGEGRTLCRAEVEGRQVVSEEESWACLPSFALHPDAVFSPPCLALCRRCQRYNAHIWLGKQTHIGEPACPALRAACLLLVLAASQ